MNNRNETYNPKIVIDSARNPALLARAISPEQIDLAPAPLIKRSARRHTVAKAKKSLRAAWLVQRVGFLVIEPFHNAQVFDALPRRSFGPGQTIPCADLLCVVERGVVQIMRSRYNLIKNIGAGAGFGEMPLLGQTMLGTEAVAGASGATIAMMNEAAARQWIAADSTWLIKTIAPRLFAAEQDHFRLQFQSRESAIAGLLLRLAGSGTRVEGITQRELGERMGIHREVMTVILRTVKSRRLIETRRKQLTILDKEALRELSEM